MSADDEQWLLAARSEPKYRTRKSIARGAKELTNRAAWIGSGVPSTCFYDSPTLRIWSNYFLIIKNIITKF
ncbi:hypothetical protein HF086_003185 [Spodoptera exigua]|uniref:Uncharacterized protein n=1 Tax=Spodoptera exigua TaxID=7107 RepID=A0A922MFI8_SPOEX|nr:hypothetical protein HF086_003185 [Spodoptera exigua]